MKGNFSACLPCPNVTPMEPEAGSMRGRGVKGDLETTMWHIKTNPLFLKDRRRTSSHCLPNNPCTPVLCEVGGRTLKTTFSFATWLPVGFTKGMLERERDNAKGGKRGTPSSLGCCSCQHHPQRLVPVSRTGPITPLFWSLQRKGWGAVAIVWPAAVITDGLQKSDVTAPA